MTRKAGKPGAAKPPTVYRDFHVPADLKALKEYASPIIHAIRRDYEEKKARWQKANRK